MALLFLCHIAQFSWFSSIDIVWSSCHEPWRHVQKHLSHLNKESTERSRPMREWSAGHVGEVIKADDQQRQPSLNLLTWDSLCPCESFCLVFKPLSSSSITFNKTIIMVSRLVCFLLSLSGFLSSASLLSLCQNTFCWTVTRPPVDLGSSRWVKVQNETRVHVGWST